MSWILKLIYQIIARSENFILLFTCKKIFEKLRVEMQNQIQ